MKVILQKEIDKLGVPGDVVTVADGYARNYLIPKRMAMPVTKGAVKNADRLRRGHDQRTQKLKFDAEQIAARMTEAPLTIPAHAGEEGRLFGSVTAAEIARELETRVGSPVDRRTIHLPEPIRSVGTHEVTVRLHPEVEPTVIVEVVAQ